MAEWNTGSKNGMWKGGRTVASTGYVLIRVGPEHHLADSRGYAYEHRLVAEEILGRRLKPGEIVHHKDENKQNNSPGNLEVISSIADHRKLHAGADEPVFDFIYSSPYTRPQLAEYLGWPGRRVGWALTRLRKAGRAIRLPSGSWVGV